MIKLFCFGPHFGVADPSPFVLKVATYMKMAGIEFESHADIRNLQRAPKGKLPYIEDDGELVADSFFIIKHLEKNMALRWMEICPISSWRNPVCWPSH